MPCNTQRMTIAARPLLDGSRPARSSLASFGWIVLVLSGAGSIAGCSADSNEEGTSGDEVGGGWRLPRAVAEAGSRVSIRYENAGSWNGGRNCSGKFREGSKALGRELMTKFGQVRSIGGYSCRRNTANASSMSVHGTGKALDIMIPTRGGRANSEAGDAVANWLVTHAAEIGVQLLIWNRTTWRSNGNNTNRYSGPNPHVDHIHAEITEKAARRQMPFFNRMVADGVVTDQPLATGQPNADGTNGDIAVFDPNDNAAQENADPNATPDLEDSDPGEEDSLGTGTRNVDDYNGPYGESKPLVGGCAATPVTTSRESMISSLGLMLAVAFVTRRRREALIAEAEGRT